MILSNDFKEIVNNPKRFIETFIKIPNKESKLVKFKLNSIQNDFYDNMTQKNIILKPRQKGFSVFVISLMLYYSLTRANITNLLVCHDRDTATELFDKLKLMYENLPDELKPETKRSNKKELIFKHNNSKIIIGTAGKLNDIGRGLSLFFCHLSELAFWKNEPEKKFQALEQSMLPNGILCIESTANGISNLYYELYMKAKARKNEYKAFFYNWYQEKELDKLHYKNAVREYKNKIGKRLAYDELDELEKKLYNDGATIEQLMYRRMKIANSGILFFQQEYPGNDLEAFISTGRACFNQQLINERMQFIPDPLKQSMITKELPTSLKLAYGTSFFMWENVKPKTKYYIGVDVSAGIGLDYSVIDVFSAEGIQVAQFSSDKIEPYKLAGILNYIGRYFCYAYIVIEKNGPGLMVIEKLRYDDDKQYMNMHKHKLFDQKGTRKKELGFLTTHKSKPLIIEHLREFFELGEILINSKRTLEELKTYIFSNNSYEASSGKKDDHVMSLAMCLEGMRTGIFYIDVNKVS